MSEERQPTTPTYEIDLREGTLQGRTFVIARVILMALCRVVLGMKVRGTERVPKEGPLLVVSNHHHNADPILICIATPRPLHYMAKAELMEKPILRPILRYGGAFPVERGQADRNAIRRALATLRQEIAFGIFPEGTRSVTGGLGRGLPGVGMIARQGKATIQPVAIVGSEKLPGNGVKARYSGIRGRRGVEIEFGEPFELPTEIAGKRVTSEDAADIIMERIADLLPESYRGVYQRHTDQTS